MSNLYTTLDSVNTSSVGPGKRMRLSGVLQHMQDAATVHATELGLGFDVLGPMQRTFVLTRMQIRLLAPPPRHQEQFVLQTWPRPLERLQAYRDFELSNAGEDGKPFLVASSSWLVIDTVARRPVRPQEFFTGFSTRDVRVMENDAPRKLDWAEELPLFDVRTARHSDLDPNGHVNNTRYVDWVTDSIAERFGTGLDIAELTINFLGEVMMGEKVNIRLGGDVGSGVVIQGESSRKNFSALVKVRA